MPDGSIGCTTAICLRMPWETLMVLALVSLVTARVTASAPL